MARSWYSMALTLPLLAFLQRPQDSFRNTLIVNIEVPDPSPNTVFRAFKTALRQLNSHAFANAAIRSDVAADGAISNVSIIYGAV